MEDTKLQGCSNPPLGSQCTGPVPPPYTGPPPAYTDEVQPIQQLSYPQQQPNMQQTSAGIQSLSTTNPHLPFGPNKVVTTVSERRRRSKYLVHDLDTDKDYVVKEKRLGCRGTKTVVKESRGGPKTVVKQTPTKTVVKQKSRLFAFTARNSKTPTAGVES